ncbi:MAG: AraC family transcriptional regulator, partial [Myxococcales bacterium]
VVIVPAGEAHRLIEVDGAEGWGVGLQPACLADPDRAWLLEPFARVRRGAVAAARVAPERRAFLETMLRELGEVTARPGGHHEQQVEALLTLVLGEVARAQTDATPALASVVGEALAFIEQHCTEGISLRDVAAAVRRSPAHLTTVTRQATGRSIGAWITSGRMAEARRRLLHSDERVDVIGERVGYADATHFIRIFRQNHGQTPAAWRRAQQAERGSLDTLRQRS